MARQAINIGTTANDGTGDPLRTAYDKCNQNFTELYAGMPTSGAPLSIAQGGTGNTAGSAVKLTTPRLIAMTGDVAWSIGSFDGSANVTAAGTIGANIVTFPKFVAATQAAFVGATAAGNFGELTPTQATAQLNVFSSTLKGLAPLSGGGTTNFLRADGVWAAPPSGTGTVTSASVVSANGFAGTVATATTTPAITISTSITGLLKGNGTAISAATAGTDYVIPSGNTATATTLATGRTLAVTGDLAWTSPAFNGSANVTAAGTLATVNGNVGTFGSTSAVPVVTVNAKGLVTGVSTVALGTLATQSGTFSGISSGTNTGDQTRAGLGAAASGANGDITSLTGLTTPLSIAQGGTGGGTAAIARTALGVAANADVQVFNANGTWTKPAGAAMVRVIVFAGGGKGGDGAVVAPGTAASGGAGGSGTYGRSSTFSASALGATESITVGAGGTAGSAQGGASNFGTWVYAYGSGGGGNGAAGLASASGGASGWASAGGNASGATAGSAGLPNGIAGTVGAASFQNSVNVGSGGAASGAAVAGGYGGVIYSLVSVGGGSGGGLTAANATSAGGAGSTNPAVISAASGGAAPGGAGASPTAVVPYEFGGAGGGGGASSTSGNGGNGGAGQVPGGGGGGGGSTQTGFTAGVGGNGGAGRVIVITTF